MTLKRFFQLEKAVHLLLNITNSTRKDRFLRRLSVMGVTITHEYLADSHLNVIVRRHDVAFA